MTNSKQSLSVEVGFVEYRSLAHAVWKEALSVIRSWRHARTAGKHPQQWYGVYLEGTEIRAAATGPLSLGTAEALCEALRSRSPLEDNSNG